MFSVRASRILYQGVVRPVLFRFDSEAVHERMTSLGERIGQLSAGRRALGRLFGSSDDMLRQRLWDIDFKSPVGLAAGFDYEARLVRLLPALGFGFGTIGTATNRPFEGNPRPRLGRLIRSRSLVVNKGFKNPGVAATLKKLSGVEFLGPVGISIGNTNRPDSTHDSAIADIVAAFKGVEEARVPFAYYEINISCPNLLRSFDFYKPAQLRKLLDALSRLQLSKPVFIKMPISESDSDVRKMLDVIVRFSFVRAVIIGNLLRDRNDAAIRADEVIRFSRGSFSGAPCRKRSDELVRLVFREYGKKLRVIGCGGIFSAEDAYRKIRLGASLVQLITGLIFEGPQLVADINAGLAALLRRDGFQTVADAVGVDA